jgi:hypothetical protein
MNVEIPVNYMVVISFLIFDYVFINSFIEKFS